MAAATDYRVLIIGGGPAGLLTAQSLLKRGIQCTVFEQDAALDTRPRDWNFGIYWAQTPLGDCLPDEWYQHVVEKCQIDRRLPRPEEVMPCYNSHTGELIKELPTPNNLRLHRRNLLRLLRTNVDIQYGKRVQRIESDGKTATAYFDDGTSDSGNLIIGADGAHSKVREFLVGEEEAKLVPSPICASSTVAILPKETAIAFQKINLRYAITFNPDGQFMWVSVHDNFENTGPGDWNFTIIQSWISEPGHDPSTLKGSNILPHMREQSSKFAEPFRSFIFSIPEGTKCWHNRLSSWAPRPWDNRNSTVTLVGDAAHPMTFHRGQGLNNAIHDAASLGKHLGERGTAVPGTGDSAVVAYESEMIERGRIAVEMSNKNSMSIHNWDSLFDSPLLTVGMKKPETEHHQPVPNGVGVELKT